MKGKFSGLLDNYFVDRNQLFYLKNYIISLIGENDSVGDLIKELSLVASNLSHDEGRAIALALESMLVMEKDLDLAIDLNMKAEKIIKAIPYYKTLHNYLTIQINFLKFYALKKDIVSLYARCLDTLEGINYLDEVYQLSYLGDLSIYYLKTLVNLELYEEAINYYQQNCKAKNLFEGKDLVIITRYVAISYSETGNYDNAINILQEIENSQLKIDKVYLNEVYFILFSVSNKVKDLSLINHYYQVIKSKTKELSEYEKLYVYYCDILYCQTIKTNLNQYHLALQIVDNLNKIDLDVINIKYVLNILKDNNDQINYLKCLNLVTKNREEKLVILKKIHNEDSLSSAKQKDYYQSFYRILYSKLELINQFHIDISTSRSLFKIRDIVIYYFKLIFPVKNIELRYFGIDQIDENFLANFDGKEIMLLQDAYDKKLMAENIKSSYHQLLRNCDGRLIGIISFNSELKTDFTSVGYEALDYTLDYLKSYLDSVYYFEEIRLDQRKDYLTKLDNCICLKKQLKKIDDGTYTMVVVDIDNLHSINDKYSLAIGDKVIKLFSSDLMSKFKGSLIARFTRSDFILLVNKNEGKTLKLLKELRESNLNYQFDGLFITLSFSAGLVKYHKSDDFDNALKHAEDAIASAKEMGRNRSVIYGGI